MNTSSNPVEMYSSRTVVAASLVVTVATVGLVLALVAPAAAMVATVGLFVAVTGRRFYGLRQKQPRSVTVPSTDVYVEP